MSQTNGLLVLTNRHVLCIKKKLKNYGVWDFNRRTFINLNCNFSTPYHAKASDFASLTNSFCLTKKEKNRSNASNTCSEKCDSYYARTCTSYHIIQSGNEKSLNRYGKNAFGWRFKKNCRLKSYLSASYHNFEITIIDRLRALLKHWISLEKITWWYRWSIRQTKNEKNNNENFFFFLSFALSFTHFVSHLAQIFHTPCAHEDVGLHS